MVEIYSKSEIEKIKISGDILKSVFNSLKEFVKVGVTTKAIDKFISDMVISYSATCSSKGYCGFPASSCISVNDEVIHGIPSDRKLNDGDLVSVDIVIEKDGFHADACRSYLIGNASDEARRLLKVTEESFFEGIKNARVGSRLHDISAAIQCYVESAGFGVVREYTGHGIGKSMHESPAVPNYGKHGTGLRLKKGMVLAIEPMVTYGNYNIKTLADKWTVKTTDGSLAAHYENTVIITDGDPEIVTL